VLLPATMKLLGDWNWYLPKWLEWLPAIWWRVEAPDLAAALSLVPPYVAERTEPIEVRDVEIP
jgi:uncharacterized membrane protein YdfJ with MMPL/SSD domain